MADDELIIGHRNSEWTGLGPIIEEDISFSSMAQDKIGHALALYTILQETFGEPDPDTVAFLRPGKEFKCCHFTEMPNGEYDFSLIRHFLFDHAEKIRYEYLESSSEQNLVNLAKKITGELKYPVLHADTFIHQLGNGSEESHARLQTAINECFDQSLGIFELGEFEQELIDNKVFPGEKALRSRWFEEITPVLEGAKLKLPDIKNEEVGFGGRKGHHTEHLQPLLDEMSEVLTIDPETKW